MHKAVGRAGRPPGSGGELPRLGAPRYAFGPDPMTPVRLLKLPTAVFATVMACGLTWVAPALGQGQEPGTSRTESNRSAATPSTAASSRPARNRPAPASTAAVSSGSAVANAISATPGNRCAEDEPVEASASGAKGSLRSADANAPRVELQNLVNLALERSQAIGAARLLAEAAVFDVKGLRPVPASA
jgi:hypothetical protein